MPDRTLLLRWATDTWRSFVAMTDPDTGLPTDSIAASLDPDTRSGYTSPTNIGGLLWCTVLGSLANVLADDCLRRWFCTPGVEAVLRPVVEARRMPIS